MTIQNMIRENHESKGIQHYSTNGAEITKINGKNQVRFSTPKYNS